MKKTFLLFFKKYKLIFLILLLVIPLYSLLLIQIDLLVGNLIDNFPKQAPTMLYKQILSFLVVSIIATIAKFLIDGSSAFMEDKLRGFLRNAIYHQIFTRGNKVVSREQLVEIWTNDVPTIANHLIEVIRNHYFKILLGVIAAVQLYFAKPFFFLIMLLLTFLFLLPLKLIGKFISNTAAAYRLSNLNFSSVLLNAIEGLEVIKTYRLSNWIIARLNQLSDQQANLLAKYIQKNNLSKILKRIIQSFIPAVILLLAHIYYDQAKLSLGEVILALALVTKIDDGICALTEISTQYKSIEQRVTAFSAVFSHQTSEVTGEQSKFKINKITNLTLQNLSLQIGTRKILDAVSLSIQRGEKVAIMGKSGVGKTMLSRLFLGLVKPTKGKIKVNDILLEQIDQETFWKHISYVPSKVLLREGRVTENIAADCKKEQLLTLIEKIKLKNLNRHIDKTASNLSGGEKKKILFARTLATINDQTDVCILDEVTTGVDSDSAQDIIDLLKQIECTVLLITHDINLAKQMDKIYYLEGGRLLSERNK